MDQALEPDLRAVYGAYMYLRATDLSGVSTTSRLLHEADIAYLAGRAGDELDELRRAVAGTHGHGHGRDDIVLEGYQSLYWLILLAVAAGDTYDEIRPHEALGATVTDATPAACWSDHTQDRLHDTVRRRATLQEGFVTIGAYCRRAGVDVSDLVERDRRELQARPYLAPYWSGKDGEPLSMLGTGQVAMNAGEAMPGRPRPDIAAMAPYVPGRLAEEVKRAYGLDHAVKLASNENPFGPSPRAVAAASRVLSASNWYPDGAAMALRERLATLYGLGRENVILGNGSDECIMLLALAYLEPGAEAIMATPPYSIHRNAVRIAGGVPVAVPLRGHTHDLAAMAAAVTSHTRLLFVANPHNPTGTVVGLDALRALAAGLPPDILLVVDEAYHDFVDDGLRHTARDLLDEYPHVVTLRTFSKAYGLAGLRIGYALAHRDVIAMLDRIRPPFDLNVVAQAAALAALDDKEYVARVVAATRAGRARLSEIARRHGFETVPSQANFVLMRVGDTAGFVEALLRRGVIVRPGENLGVPGWVRVSVGTSDDLDVFDRALDEAIAQGEIAAYKRLLDNACEAAQ